MKKEFVLIYVSGGIAHVHNSSSTPVAVLDMDVQWDTHEQELIHEQEQAAYDRLCGQLGEETPELSMTGLEQALSSPAPVDWAKELERLEDLRNRAIRYITETVSANGGEIRKRITYNNHSQLFVCNINQDWGSMSVVRAIGLAANVQRAIKGGAGK